MKSSEIRDRFSQFFIKNGHLKVESSSLVPHDDPTLLFANAGMNQFKDYFTGKSNPKDKRAVTVQKCVRAGGKHNDLDNVGFTARHHTFFEMLGNFSFGDYFKKEAIHYAWKLLTEEFKIPKDKLLVTVHESDQEAANIWHNQEGVPRDRILYKGDKDNFWEMGEYGPCGPCSEIFYDHGEKYSSMPFNKADPLIDEKRFVEIWNLVFMQYEKSPQGTIKLPKPSVDTGAGLERIAAALQGVHWNYDSDLFQTIIKDLEKISGQKYSDPKAASSMRVIADHIRSSTMIITDGCLPSNEGRGYVLRRIIRRAIRFGNELGIKENFLTQLVPSVFQQLGSEYPQNKANASLAVTTLEGEENKFRETLQLGVKTFHEYLQKNQSTKMFDGEVAFKLYDTFGFPLDLTQLMAKEKNLEVDVKTFDKKMSEQKLKSKKSSQFKPAADDLKNLHSIKEKLGETKFTGYTELKSKSKLIHIYQSESARGFIFDTTPFYAESGGQVGDRGTITLKSGKILSIVDTIKPIDGLFLHITDSPIDSEIKVGDSYELTVDQRLRSLTTKNHSATHLLQAALIKVLGPHVKQSGSLVNEERLRFDFTHHQAVTEEQQRQIEDLVNEAVTQSLPVKIELLKKDEALNRGAMALFGEKYEDVVRVITMGDFSVEFCGGTHVQSTSDIGPFKIFIETSLAQGVRRIEAITSETAWNYLRKRSDWLKNIEQLFSLPGEQSVAKANELVMELKKKEKHIQALEEKIKISEVENLFSKSEKMGKYDFFEIESPYEVKEFRFLSDQFANRQKESLLFLFKKDEDRLSFFLRSGLNLSAFDWQKVVAPIQGKVVFKGGGKGPSFQGTCAGQDQTLLIKLIKEEISKL